MTVRRADAQTTGQMDFSVTTVDNGAGFTPKHVLAIWIEDESGNFVKTLELMANKRIQYLYTWNTSSGGNTTDAVTGATLADHRTEETSWDCTDTSGNISPDGNYNVIIEYTSEHAQGPLATFSFNKSGDVISLQPTNETYFTSISVDYTPDATNINDFARSMKHSLKIYPNPFTDNLTVDFNARAEQEIKMSIYNTSMQLLHVIYEGRVSEGKNTVHWNGPSSDLPPGNYYLVVENGKSIMARGIIKAR